MYMANASPNARGPNATYIPPVWVGFALGPWGLCVGSAWLCVGSAWLCVGSARLFKILTCWYWQRESLPLGPAPNASSFSLQWNIGLTVIVEPPSPNSQIVMVPFLIPGTPYYVIV